MSKIQTKTRTTTNVEFAQNFRTSPWNNHEQDTKHHELTCNISIFFFFWTKILVRGMDEFSLHGGDQLGHLQFPVQTGSATTHRFTITKKTFSRHSTNIQSRGAVSLVSDDWFSAGTRCHFLVSTGSPNISHTCGFVSHNWLHFLHIRPDRLLWL